MPEHTMLAIRLLLRDWNAGELKVLLLALVIAVASMTSIGVFTNRIEHSMTDQAGQFLGADLLVKSSRVIDQSIIFKANEFGLRSSEAISFASVISVGDEFQLAHIKAVDKYYPLLSQVKIAHTLYGNDMLVSHGPAPGEVWLAPRLFSSLGITLNQLVEIGQIKLKVTAVLKQDPGENSSLIAVAPRVLMNIQDVINTGIVQPGSRVNYLNSFAGKQENRQRFEKWLTPKLTSTQSLIGGTENSEAISSAMQKADQYLSLASMLSVMLSGIAIAMAANRYGQRHFDQVALMRCMGATQTSIMKIFAIQLIALGSLASLIGILFGYLAQQGLVYILSDLFVRELPSPSLYPLIVGFLSGFITLGGFSYPTIMRLRQVSPLRVLRNDISPLNISAWIVYGLATLAVILLMWWQSGHLVLTLLVLLGTLSCIIILFVITSIMTKISSFLIPILKGPWKTGLQQIIRYKRENQLQILVFGLSLLILMTIYLIRTDLFDRWQAQLPDDAPNHFVINIQSYETDKVNSFFHEKSINSEGLYPMVRGRITHINDISISDDSTDKRQLDESLKRELNLSWSNVLQKNNSLIKGNWWDENDTGKQYISIEKGLARRLQVDIGDKLSFLIADRSIDVTIRSIRSVQWESFQPNFYILFPPGSIEQFPATYISSFYIEKERKNILNQLVKEFPTLTVLEIDEIMQQVRSIMQQVSLAIEYVMLFVLMAGTMVLIASMQSSMDHRNQNAIIMRTLGASSSYLRRALFSEFILLGLFSGILAIIGTEIISLLLYEQIFELDFQPHYILWLAGPVISISLILFISWIYMRHIPRQSPLKIMR